jgi:hypothetical protein
VLKAQKPKSRPEKKQGPGASSHESATGEIDEAWATGHRYLDMAEYLAWMKVPKEGETIRATKTEPEVA